MPENETEQPEVKEEVKLSAEQIAAAEIASDADRELREAVVEERTANVNDAVEAEQALQNAQIESQSATTGRARASSETAIERAEKRRDDALSKIDDEEQRYWAYTWRGHLRFNCGYCAFDTGSPTAMKQHLGEFHPGSAEDLGPQKFDRWGRPINREE